MAPGNEQNMTQQYTNLQCDIQKGSRINSPSKTSDSSDSPFLLCSRSFKYEAVKKKYFHKKRRKDFSLCWNTWPAV